MNTIKHKGNGKAYAKKVLHPFTMSIKQNSNCEWEDAFAYFDPMKPNHLFVTGRDRMVDRFEIVKSNYNGDELYDDVFEVIHAELKNTGASSIDVTNEIMRKIQPKIEVLNSALN